MKIKIFNIKELADEIERAIATAKICNESALYVTRGKKLNRCHCCLAALEKFLASIKGRHNHYRNHIEKLLSMRQECHTYGLSINSCLLEIVPDFREILPLFLLSKVEEMIEKFSKARSKHNKLVHIMNTTRRIAEYLEILQDKGINHPAMTQMQSIAKDLNLQFAYATALYNPCPIIKRP